MPNLNLFIPGLTRTLHSYNWLQYQTQFKATVYRPDRYLLNPRFNVYLSSCITHKLHSNFLQSSFQSSFNSIHYFPISPFSLTTYPRLVFYCLHMVDFSKLHTTKTAKYRVLVYLQLSQMTSKLSSMLNLHTLDKIVRKSRLQWENPQ